jgi:crossover junction endodeoxyribonuclease RuvC
MIVLGIDPGTAALGYGILERTGGRLRSVDYGCVTTTPDRSLPDRLNAIHQAVTELIELHRPAIVGIERLFFSRNAQTAFAVGQARGVVLLAAAQHGLRVCEAAPNVVKTAVAGYGSADKEQVSRMVQIVLELDERPWPDDAADALAVAIWAAHHGLDDASGHLGATVMDRAAVAPLEREATPYERAVRAALAGERRSGG